MLLEVVISVVAIILVPDPMHVLWLAFLKIYLPGHLFFMDSLTVGTNLRWHPVIFAKIIGKDTGGKKQNGKLMVLIILTAFLVVGLDIMRHYLVVSFGQDFELINIVNPLSSDGKSVKWGAGELASALFWGSTIFTARTMFTGLVDAKTRTVVPLLRRAAALAHHRR